MKKRSMPAIAACLLAFWVFSSLSCDIFNAGPDEEPGIDPNLGRGYDVSMEYANPEVAKSRVLDTAALQESDLIETLPINQTDNYYSFGESVEEYLVSLAATADLEGSYGCFGGSVSMNFATSNHVYTSHSFATIQTMISRTKSQVPESVSTETLKSYLLSDAKNAINNTGITPEELFDTYGTHVMTGVITGARLDYSIHCNMSRMDTAKTIDVLAKAAYNGAVAKISASAGVLTSEERASLLKNGESRCSTVGGNSEYGDKILEDNAYYDRWVESIDETSLFCGYTHGGLRPIWEFADNRGRADELRAAYAPYLVSHQVEEIDEPTTPDQQVLARIYEASHEGFPGYALYGLLKVPDLSRLKSADNRTTVVDLITNDVLMQERNVNEKISSVVVADGYVLTLYKFVNYLSEAFQYVGVVDIVTVNDDASSLEIVENKGLDGNPVAVVYAAANYGSKVKNYYSDVKDRHLGGYMGDQISSVRILNPAYQVILWEHDNLAGRKRVITADTVYLSDFNDEASSLEVALK